MYQSGQYAIRGSVIDLFPAGSSNPYRLDLFDEEIESIRLFGPESQRSTGKVERIALLPAREYPCDDQSLEAFRRAFRYRFAVDTRNANLYQDLRAGVLPQGLEQYLPLFHERTSFLLDYLQDRPRLVVQDGFHAAAEDLERRTCERWEQRRHDVERPVLEREEARDCRADDLRLAAALWAAGGHGREAAPAAPAVNLAGLLTPAQP